MDFAKKKRKPAGNGPAGAGAGAGGGGGGGAPLTSEEVSRVLGPFSREQLAGIVASAACRDAGALDAVRALADRDLAHRKLFIRGLGWETTAGTLRSLFSPFGDLEEAVVISDKSTGKSKGYGFIVFRHFDGALRALRDPSKTIDGRLTVTQLAAAGTPNSSSAAAAPRAADVSQRKVFVGNVPSDMPSDRLLAYFASYGEIEEGPLGLDKQTGRFRGYALFVYKTPEAARASLVMPTKTIDGHHLVCRLASEGKKGKPVPAPTTSAAPDIAGSGSGSGSGSRIGTGLQASLQSSVPGQFGRPNSTISSYSNLAGSGLPAAAVLGHNLPPSQPSAVAGATPGLSAVPGQVPALLGGAGPGGYGGGLDGYYGSSQFGGFGGLGMGTGSSLYRVPPTSIGVPSGGYSDSAHYSLSSSAYPSQHLQKIGSSPGPGAMVPSGAGLYPTLPPYF